MPNDTEQAVSDHLIERVARAIADAVARQSDSGVYPKWSDFRDEAVAAIRALTPTASEATAIGAGDVTQADREAAAMLMLDLSGYDEIEERRLVSGNFDQHAAIQALACHRIAASPKVASDTAPGVREALEWYGEQARLARLIHSEGDAGRNALAADGGKRALAALAASPTASDTDTAIPGGWKLVPIEPTGAMIEAACGMFPAPAYRAMLAASPKPDTLAAKPIAGMGAGEVYRSACDCACHEPGAAILHVQPCCWPDPKK